MKVGIVYTATNPESVEAINAEISKKLGGFGVAALAKALEAKGMQ